MKKTNITLSRGIGASPTIVNSGTLLQSMAFFIICLLSINPLQAQDPCALSCHGANVSVDMTCSALITTSMVADTSSCMSGSFVVYVMTTENDTIETSPLVDFDQLGETLKVSVVDEISGNSCWSYVTIEDKMPPMITCADDTIDCTDLAVLAPPVAEDNCTIGSVTLVDEDIAALCDSNYIKTISQDFTATDLAGNKSDTCTQILTLRRIDFSKIVWPEPKSIATNNAISCTAPFPDADNDGNPDPLPYPIGGGTGVPTINGVPIYPDFNFICNSATTFEDVNISPLNCVRKIMRMWTVREWHCTGERDTTFLQLIEIVDETGPEITCPPDEVDLTTTFLNCNASYLLPELPITDDCSQVSLVTVSYPGGFANTNGGFQVDLPVGENLITYTAYDDCLNSTECTITVNVADNTPPVPICDEHTIIALTGYENGGLTLVPAEVFDDGSYDECGDVTFTVQRMTSCIDFDWTTQGAGIDNDPNGIVNSADLGTVVRSRVPLACCDIGPEILMVALIVTDESGNTNSCMVEIEVQDKLAPIIDCPSNITVSCEFDYDLDNLSIFGDIVTSEAERDQFCVYDPNNHYGNQDGFVCGLDGLALDNCTLEIIPSVRENVNNCGVGYIDRTFIARDPNGSASCTQRITIENYDPFTTLDIRWPLDYTGAECGLGTDPEDLPAPFNMPTVTEDECDLVGINHEDQVFEFVEGACFKILRTWRVIEWCLYEEAGGLEEGYNYWERTQVIKVQNAFGPEFTTEQTPIDECNDVDCGGLTFTLTQQATDDCTPVDELDWSYEIDLFTDNTVNYSNSGSGGRIEFTREFPIGSHRVLFTFEDRCGNRTSKEQLVNVESCKAPQPVCISGLSTDLMADGTVRIWASDFDASSVHPCGIPVTVAFSPDPDDIYMDFNCSHFGVGQVPVQLYAIDANGLYAYCETYIIIQDNMNACDGTGGQLATIGGDVNTETALDVAEVEMTLQGSGMLPVVTTTTGNYTFPEMVLGGTYDVMPARDGDDKNGVSTLDLVRIQKHLLGIQPIESPYQMIAADANNSKSVSAIDLIELRKLILGIYDELPSNESWRFVESQYSFPDPFNPWFEVFPESYHLSSLTQSMANIDFVAIKIGDLNNTVVANATQVTTRNAQDVLTFMVDDQKAAKGELIEMEVTADQFTDLQGFQFTMGLNSRALEFVGVQSGAIDVSEDNFGLNRLDQGALTMSWFSMKAQSISADDVLFTMTFRANNTVIISDAVSMNSDVTNAEAYQSDEEMLDVALEFRGGIAKDSEFELFQNIPNPFNHSTRIAFKLPKASDATITVFDVTGKQLAKVDVAGVKGYNEIELNRSQLSGSGIMYYQLATDGYTASQKMVVLD